MPCRLDPEWSRRATRWADSGRNRTRPAPTTKAMILTCQRNAVVALGQCCDDKKRARPQVRSGSVVVFLACTDQQDLAESTPTCRRCQWNQGRGLPAGAPENGTGLKRCPNGAACVRSGCKAEHPRTSARNVDSCDAKTGRQPGAVWRVIKRQAVIWRTQQSVAKAATRCVIRITSGKNPPRDS
jgi:hypothetical protein